MTRPGQALSGVRQANWREGFARFIIRPECVVDGAAPSMLTHRETAVMASLSRGVRLGR